jgi:hypothetical protein
VRRGRRVVHRDQLLLGAHVLGLARDLSRCGVRRVGCGMHRRHPVLLGDLFQPDLPLTMGAHGAAVQPRVSASSPATRCS